MEIIQKILRQAVLILKDPNFIAKHRLKPTAFTRRRKLPFERIVGTLIHLVRNSLQIVCNRLGEYFHMDDPASKQAFSQARSNLSYSCFQELNDLALQAFYQEDKSGIWKGRRLIAADTCQLCALNHQTVLVESRMDEVKDPKYLITNDLHLEAQAVLEIYSWRWLIEEFFGDEKKLLDFEGARVRNYQAGALTVLTLSCADLLLSLEIFKLSQENSQSRALTVSSMIAKIQEENIHALLEALESVENGDYVAKKWLEVLKKGSTRYRRQRKELCKLSEKTVEDFVAGENFMAG